MKEREDITKLKAQMAIYKREMALIAAKHMIRKGLDSKLEQLSFSMHTWSPRIIQ